MVKVRDDLPRSHSGEIDLEQWIDRICAHKKQLDKALITKAAHFNLDAGGHILTPYQDSCFRYGLTIAEILVTLEPDTPTLIAAMLYHTVYFEGATLEEIKEAFGDEVVSLIKGLSHIDSTQSKQTQTQNKKGYTFTANNPDNLRRMLLAVVEDLRVVLIKLAERIAALRACANLPEPVKQHIAKEAQDIYAPLANRLGIGQIKWEIEDFAFRYLQPTEYKQIAKSLDEKRLDRENYLQLVIEQIKHSLASEEIKAEVFGRVKHIFSIWRKMQRKNLEFSEIYDVRAVRILVSQVKDCYAALGVVHGLWKHIPKEFDDYIATPKENGYRSLHTAVIGPQGKTIEVQIRTHDMDAEAELGVAAHWVYKEGGPLDTDYQAKLNAIRSLLEEGDEMQDSKETEQFLQSSIEDDRVYVFSPAGDVIDLPYGSTPIDFAFSIHTELGFRCRGAKANGKMVPLTYKLKSGDQLEILTVKEGGPSRDWLNLSLGYLKSSKAISKVHNWFRRQERDKNIEQGKDLLEKEFKRLNLTDVALTKIAAGLHYKHLDDLYAALGGGDIRLGQILNAIHVTTQPPKEEDIPTTHKKATHKSSDIHVQGVGHLKCTFAKCCKPVPGDRIIGFITIGRGVTIHQDDCMNILEKTDEDRLIKVEWGGAKESVFPVDIEIIAYDRQGLLRDITGILSNEKINVTGSSSSTNTLESTARVVLNCQVKDLETLGRLLNKISQLPNVIEAKRI